MPETHKKKKKCDGHILIRLTRGSQNTIVSAAKYILCVAVKIQSHLRRIKKKKTCDANILLRLMRGSQNTIVSATHETHEFFFFFSLQASAKYILCVAVKIQSYLRRMTFFFHRALPQTSQNYSSHDLHYAWF